MKIERKNIDDILDYGQCLPQSDYVYALRDPRDQKVFYIGQASYNQNNINQRVFDHFVDADNFLRNPNGSTPSTHTLRIIEIWSEDLDVEWFILAHKIHNKKCLDSIESAAIDLLSESQNGPALNKIKGKHSTLLTKDNLCVNAAQYVKPSQDYPFVYIFPIHNQLLNRPTEYDATRGFWIVSQYNRNQNGIAVGVSNYVSKGVFEINDWNPVGNKWEFDGNDLSNGHELMNANWYKVISNAIGYWQRGNYLIVKIRFKNNISEFRFVRGNSDKSSWFQF